jgi:type III restriction enzyme
MQLRKVEDAKIECAEKLFKTMSNANIAYGKVDSYQELINIMKS